MSKHIVEGVSQFVSNLLDLQLLSVDLVLDVVNPLVQLGDVHLPVLEPALSELVLALDAEDLVLQLLLSFNSLGDGMVRRHDIHYIRSVDVLPSLQIAPAADANQFSFGPGGDGPQQPQQGFNF